MRCKQSLHLSSTMTSLCNSLDTLPLKPISLHGTDLHFSRSPSLTFPATSLTNNKLTVTSKPSLTSFRLISRPSPIRLSSASMSDIDMVRNNEGIYTPKRSRVVVLWDLDNKPPRGPPYEAAMALRQVAQRFGDIVDISAYANRHAFIHLPQWVLQERRERKQLDVLERKGVVRSSDPYVCGVCGRKCKTNLDLKKHFKQLHERERQKKLNRMRSLKGKKRQKYKERYITGNQKYNEAASSMITPKVGYGLASELRRAGVFVKTVEDKPQAADWALKRQMQHSLTRGIDWLFLVSDDKDFAEMLRKARDANLGTVVVGDWDRALGKHADLWVPWVEVENGELTEKDLMPERRGRQDLEEGVLFSVSCFDGRSDLDSVVDELVVQRTAHGGVRISAFSEGEEDEDEDEDEDDDDWVAEEDWDNEDYLLRASEDEIVEEDEGYF